MINSIHSFTQSSIGPWFAGFICVVVGFSVTLVRADGAVAFGNVVGSIHRAGALAQGLDACNGWTFWHIETSKGLTSIDALRAQVRAEMATP